MKALSVLVVLMLIGVTAGCNKPASTALHNVSQSGTRIEQYQTFSTTFTVPLSQQRRLIVTSVSKPWLEHGYLSFDDGLIQRDGKHVSFDCDNIADKIIDANLVVEITPICSAVHKQVKAFWKQHDYVPDEFMDSTGQKWRKK